MCRLTSSVTQEDGSDAHLLRCLHPHCQSPDMSSSPADDVIALYQTHAAAFAALRSTELIERAWLAAFLERLAVPHASEYRQLLAENGFSVVRHQQEDPACGGATVWLAMQGARNDARRPSTDLPEG